jgi:2-succinyl-6-hydroxy-2,4-cyclohexadiene-1-carboxylate synthase
VLHVDVSGSGPPVVLFHGFTQNGRCWGAFGEELEKRFTTIRVDLPGHGFSNHDDADLVETAALCAEVIASSASSAGTAGSGGRATCIGYSLGGRVGLHLALNHPEVVARLVLIGATAGIENAIDRAHRVAADEALARALEADGLEVFLQHWLALPLFSGLNDAQAALAHRMTNRVEGLAASLRSVGTGQQENLWPRLADINVPTLILTGDNDTKFTELGRRLQSSIGMRAELVQVLGVGHSVPLEAPGVTQLIVSEWLTRSER